MKKMIFVGILTFSTLALAQVIPVEVPAAGGLAGAKALLLLMAANGGLTLIRFLLGYIPVVGPYIQKLLDVFMANPAHP